MSNLRAFIIEDSVDNTVMFADALGDIGVSLGSFVLLWRWLIFLDDWEV